MILSFLEEYNSNGGSQATCLKNTVKVAIKPSARLVNIVLSVNMQPCALFVSCITSFIGLLLLFFINTVVSVNINTNAFFVFLQNNFYSSSPYFLCNLSSLDHQVHWPGQLYDYSKLMTPEPWTFLLPLSLEKKANISIIGNMMIPVMVIMTTSNIWCDDSEDRDNFDDDDTPHVIWW